MTSELREHSPRSSIFAVWRWPRWSLSILLSAAFLATYITSYAASKWMLSGRIIEQGLAFKIEASIVFRQLNWYESTDLPGASFLTTLSRWCIYRSQGSKISWKQATESTSAVREIRRMNAELERERKQKAPHPTADETVP